MYSLVFQPFTIYWELIYSLAPHLYAPLVEKVYSRVVGWKSSSIMIFCLWCLWVVEKNVKITVIVVAFFNCIHFCLMCFEVLDIRHIHIYDCLPDKLTLLSLWSDPLTLAIHFYLEIYFIWYEYSHSNLPMLNHLKGYLWHLFLASLSLCTESQCSLH